MSRIGKKPIIIPENVEVKIEGAQIKVKGPKGELSGGIFPQIRVELKEKKIHLLPQKATLKSKALWGLSRTLISNMIEGVIKGFEKRLEIEGIGFKARVEEGNLVLEVGFSYPVKIAAPENIQFSVEKNLIIVSGIDKGLVGQVAANIKKVRPPDSYKGKGIRYQGEVIRKKLGKKTATTTG